MPAVALKIVWFNSFVQSYCVILIEITLSSLVKEKASKAKVHELVKEIYILHFLIFRLELSLQDSYVLSWKLEEPEKQKEEKISGNSIKICDHIDINGREMDLALYTRFDQQKLSLSVCYICVPFYLFGLLTMISCN